MPFYAGWGITKDQQVCIRREKKLSVEEVFAAAYILYPRYIDPYTKELTTLERTLDIISFWKEINQKNRANGYICSGIRSWKQKVYRRFLFSTHAPCRASFTHNFLSALKKSRNTRKKLVSWSSKVPESMLNTLPQNNVLLTEDGFIRSVGLGVALTPPGSIVLDRRGIYYNAQRPSDLEQYFVASSIFR